MHWWLIFEEFGPDIHHIARFDNIVADTWSILPSTTINKHDPCTSRYQCLANNLFALGKVENKENFFPLNIFIVKIEQKKEPININSKLSTYISDQGSGYSMQALNNVKIIFYDSKIYVPQSLRRLVLDLYHLYLNHPGGIILAKEI